MARGRRLLRGPTVDSPEEVRPDGEVGFRVDDELAVRERGGGQSTRTLDELLGAFREAATL